MRFMFVVSVLVVALGFGIAPAKANSANYQKVLFQSGQGGQQVLRINSAQQAVQLVKRQYGGKILKVQRQKVNGKPGYRVKLLKDNGNVVSVLVDAKSGRIIG